LLMQVKRSADFGLRWHPVLLVAAAAVLLSAGTAEANWLSDVFKGKAKPDKTVHATSKKRPTPEKQAAAPKHHTSKVAALIVSSPTPPGKPVATACDPSKFRIVVDVGHTAESEGAISARNVAEFLFNLRLAKKVEEKLKAEGFPETRLLVTEGKARSSLVRRVNAASNLHANLFLSIHHDSVPDKFMESWEFEGKKSHFSDRFGGYSVFVSHDNGDFPTSLAFAELLAKQMKAKGLQYARQYSQPVMGHYQHPLLNKETGVYSYDKLIVLKTTRMPAVLLEAGSIINRDEELKMDSAEQRDITSSAVAAAAKEFCAPRKSDAQPSRWRGDRAPIWHADARRRCTGGHDADDTDIRGFQSAEGLRLFARCGPDDRPGHPLRGISQFCRAADQRVSRRRVHPH
jgi:N-acetylmuramoyl-L-alanine amidase